MPEDTLRPKRGPFMPAGAAAVTPEDWERSQWKKEVDSGAIKPPSHPEELPSGDGRTADASGSATNEDGAVAPASYSGPGRYHAVRDGYVRYCPIGQSFGWIRGGPPDHMDAQMYSSGYVYGYIYGCMNQYGWVQANAIAPGN